MLPEQDAFIEELFQEYFNKLKLYAISYLRDTNRAQDVVQDTFHTALLHIDELMVHDNPGGWLMNTVKNKIRESERSRRRYLHRFFSLDSDISSEIFPSNELVTELREPEDAFPMEKIRQALTEEEYRLLTRFVLDKASHLEVARELNISVYASQKRLERIRDKLYKIFPERKNRKKK